MSSEAHTEAVKREPTAEAEVVKGAPNKYYLTVFLLTLSVMVITMITLVTGQWLKRDGTDTKVYEQFSLWGYCWCDQLDVAFQCPEQKRLVRGAQGFSLIALGCEFIAVIVFAFLYANIGSTKTRPVGIVFAWLGTIALILTWTMWAGTFNVSRCNGIKIKDIGDLHWSFGLRVAESVIWIIAAVLLSISASRSQQFNKAALFIAVAVFIVTVATTTGRGWTIGQGETAEVSLWEYCNCTRSNSFDCFPERRFFRSWQGMATLGVVLQFVILTFVIFEIPAIVQAIFGFITVVCILVTFTVFAWWYNKDFCGQPSANKNFTLYWPYGLNCIAFILQVVNFVVAVVGACGAF